MKRILAPSLPTAFLGGRAIVPLGYGYYGDCYSRGRGLSPVRDHRAEPDLAASDNVTDADPNEIVAPQLPLDGENEERSRARMVRCLRIRIGKTYFSFDDRLLAE